MSIFYEIYIIINKTSSYNWYALQFDHHDDQH